MSIYDYYITPEEYETAGKNGVNRWTLENRVRNLRWNKERAITTPPKKHRDWSEFTKIADENGIERRLFYNRVHRGMSPIDAATRKKQCKKTWHKEMDKRRKANFRYPLWVYDKLKEIGLSADNFHSRIERGNFTFEEALTTPPLSPEECGKRGTKARKDNENKVFV